MGSPENIDPAAPARGVLAVAGSVPIAEAARRLGVKPATVSGYCEAGDGVRLSTLIALAKACGGTIEIRFVSID